MLWAIVQNTMAQHTAANIPTKRMVEYYDKAKHKPKQVYFVMQNKPSIQHGDFVEYYYNGQTKTQGQYTKGKTTGYWEYFYENGKPKMKGTLRNGVQQESWKYFYENGKLSRKGMMRDGQKIGLWAFYYENGNAKSEGIIEDGKNEGLWTYYYENGNKKATALYVRGRGFYKEVYDTGEPKMQGIIDNGKSDSLWQYFHENGKLKAEGLEKNGVKQGNWRFYHANGVLASEGAYSNGELDGNWKYYYESGKLSSEGQQQKGQKQGHWRLYYESGKFMGEGFFENGNGPYKEYYDNGKLRIEGYLQNGKNHGLWTYYYEDGVVEGRCEYLNGEGLYKGMYRNGTIKMTGKLKDGQKVGQWSLYNEDGSFAGYYKTFYNKELPVSKHNPAPADTVKPLPVVHVKPTGKPDFIQKKRLPRYFVKRINESKGLMLSFNPLPIMFNELPISIEYYWHERLGYELRYTVLRNPFFSEHGGTIQPDRLYKNGFNVDFRQKLYHPNGGAGSFYISQEVRFSQVDYSAKVTEMTDSLTSYYKEYKANETRIELAVTAGNRLFWTLSRHLTLSADMYAGIAAAYRQTNVPDALVFQQVRTSKYSFPLRFGFSIGLLYSKHGVFD
ncbi:Antitoxin component YwqK of the YwqJK toxin-antitoxin module [Flexibacter flexilis DSM 6793]|uniref:Antitoxin component YwqK of the YwqJK toxin-antitoxin module n=2 Tax=Flexibacter flexilis TaxID=998 RepID=A0A1I1HSK6_9BACT|nr:Antitoxin component YwqK of the YwqJK toxin-antitoxin module [Flexibacter flexilis DSM 6793]